MGLKKDNYYSQSLGISLPTAYAVLKDLVLNGNNARAIFVIQSSRDATQTLKPIEKVEVYFEWDRKSDLAKIAYEKAKTQIIKDYLTDIEVEKCGVLFAWQDDIIE